jgi:hypothetical protein
VTGAITPNGSAVHDVDDDRGRQHQAHVLARLAAQGCASIHLIDRVVRDDLDPGLGPDGARQPSDLDRSGFLDAVTLAAGSYDVASSGTYTVLIDPEQDTVLGHGEPVDGSRRRQRPRHP